MSTFEYDEAELLQRPLGYKERETLKREVSFARVDLPADAFEERARLVAVHLMCWWHRSAEAMPNHPDFSRYVAHLLTSITASDFDIVFGNGMHSALAAKFGTVDPQELCIPIGTSYWQMPRGLKRRKRGSR